MNSGKINYFIHNIDDDDIENVSSVLKSVFLTTGSVVAEFEDRFSHYLSIHQTVGLTSCTGALHLGLLAWDIGPGDEVITTPMSFCATSNSIIEAGATPVFIDVEENTGNINAELIEAAITDKTKAIMPVHLYGQMCDMRRLREIADKYNLIIIEDAAHCIEGERDGVKPGQLGHAACFSFYATKNITCGEGGAICTNDVEKAELLRMMRHHGIDKSSADRYTKRYKHWDMPVFGWKYNMDNIQAALLIGQLQRIDSLWEQRNRLGMMYEEHLGGQKGIEIVKTVPGSKHARHLFTVLVDPDRRDDILWTMQDKGIGVAVNYRPIHLLKYYRDSFGYTEGLFPVAEDIGKKTITMPLYPKLKKEEAETVCNALLEILK
jgi:dTDP-4-amino-4,6-dideoxygalactose transaminase